MVSKRKKKNKIIGTDKKVKQWHKTKNVIQTIYFFLGALFMLIMILIVLGVLTQGEIIHWFGF